MHADEYAQRTFHIRIIVFSHGMYKQTTYKWLHKMSYKRLYAVMYMWQFTFAYNNTYKICKFIFI